MKKYIWFLFFIFLNGCMKSPSSDSTAAGTSSTGGIGAVGPGAFSTLSYTRTPTSFSSFIPNNIYNLAYLACPATTDPTNPGDSTSFYYLAPYPVSPHMINFLNYGQYSMMTVTSVYGTGASFDVTAFQEAYGWPQWGPTFYMTLSSYPATLSAGMPMLSSITDPYIYLYFNQLSTLGNSATNVVQGSYSPVIVPISLGDLTAITALTQNFPALVNGNFGIQTSYGLAVCDVNCIAQSGTSLGSSTSIHLSDLGRLTSTDLTNIASYANTVYNSYSYGSYTSYSFTGCQLEFGPNLPAY